MLDGAGASAFVEADIFLTRGGTRGGYFVVGGHNGGRTEARPYGKWCNYL